MNHEKATELKQKASVMDAAANGAAIQSRPRNSMMRTGPHPNGWKDDPDPSWAWNTFEYRVKPDLTYREWTHDEIPIGALVRDKGDDRGPVRTILSIGSAGEGSDIVVLRSGKGFTQWTRSYALAHLEHSTTGRKGPWLPCGVLVEKVEK